MAKPFVTAVVLIARRAGWTLGIPTHGTLYFSGTGREGDAIKIPTTFQAEVEQSLNSINGVLKRAWMAPF
jgi:hypothetical protein